jgi:tetratricopeptide (TPR) repeat protein
VLAYYLTPYGSFREGAMVDGAWLAAAAVVFAGIGALFAAPARAEELPDFDALWNYGDPAATEAKFREVLPKAEASGNADYLAQLWTQIARTKSLRRQFDEAHAILDKVEASLKEGMTTARVRLWLERGRTFNSAQRKDEARPLFLEAWEKAKAAKLDAHAVDAAHMMGIVEAGDLALEWNRKALELANASKDPIANRWVGALCQNTGYTLLQLGRLDQAMETFRKGLAWSTERKRPSQVRMFRWFVGRTLRAQGKFDEALAIQKELEKEYEGIGETDGYVHEEIAECLAGLEKADEAKPYFKKAYDLLSKDPDVASDAKRLERLRTLGGVAR